MKSYVATGLTTVTCDHKVTTDNKYYKSLYVGFGAFYSQNSYICKSPLFGFLSSPYFPTTHLASCLTLTGRPWLHVYMAKDTLNKLFATLYNVSDNFVTPLITVFT